MGTFSPVESSTAKMALSTSSLLLTLYVTCETIRASYAYYAFHNYPQISASAIAFLSEVLKLSIAVFFLLRSQQGFSVDLLKKYYNSAHNGEIDYRRILRYALPAALYLTNNLIYYTVLPLTSPSLLQVCVLAKLPTTGILHHYMVKPQHNRFAWLSLLFLCIGLGVFNIPSKPSASTGEAVAAWYLAPVAGFIIACLSALASISTETSTKEGDFWVSQAYLYTWGVVFAIISYPLLPSSGRQQEPDHSSGPSGMLMAVIGLVTVTSVTGLVVAVVLRARDNILKVIGTAASLVTVAVSQFVLLPELRASTFTPWKVCGGLIVTTSTWCYNHYSQEPWLYNSIDEESPTADDEAEKDFAQVPEVEDSILSLRPSATKIAGCAVVTAFLTWEVYLRSEN